MTTASELMTVDIPRDNGHHMVGDIVATLQHHTWEEVGHVYLLDDQAALVGQIPIERLLQAKENTSLAELKGLPPIEVLPGDSAETWRYAPSNAMKRMSPSSTATASCWALFRLDDSVRINNSISRRWRL